MMSPNWREQGDSDLTMSKDSDTRIRKQFLTSGGPHEFDTSRMLVGHWKENQNMYG